ncbi:MAG: DUF481 domain-containing protein [Myxococcales bacterium]|nr:DUF481 domain-containing protein [Myxococcales bacterium]
MPQFLQRFVLLALLALLITAGASEANAGIYNMQSILATEADEGISGAISGSANWRRGNVDYLFLSATPLARYRVGNHLIIGMMRGDHKTSGGATIISNTLEHLRYRYTISDALLGEVFAQHEFNDVKRLNLRALVGAGPKATLVNGSSYALDVGVSYMLEYQRLQDDEFADAGNTDVQHRNSTYVTGHYQADDRVQLAESVYVQPRLTDASDIRLLSETQLTFKMTKRLSFTSSLTIAYDSRPPDAVKRLDTALSSSISFEL